MNKNIIKVISGIRRCGKSTILQQIIQDLKEDGIKDENIILINFELRRYFHIKTITQLDELINDLVKNKSEKITFCLMRYRKLKIGKTNQFLFSRRKLRYLYHRIKC